MAFLTSDLLDMRFFIFFSFILFPIFLCGQSITLKKGDKKVVLPVDGFYRFANGVIEADDECYDCIGIKGIISRVYKDSISVALKSINRNIVRNKIESSVNIKTIIDLETNIWTFAKKDVYHIDVYKSAAQAKRNRGLDGLGGMLILTGVVTAASSLLIKKDEGRESLLIAAGIEGALGVGLIAVINRKKYKLYGDDAWQFE